MPEVSIILPVYNGADFLEDAILSVLDQSYKDYELLVIDDASTDHSLSIVKRYQIQDQRIRILSHTHNLGVVKCLNMGIAQSEGSLIARVDADDIWLPGKLEKQVIFLQQHPDIYLLGTGKYNVKRNLDILPRKAYPDIYSSPDIRRNILHKNLFCHSSVIFRRELVDKIGAYDESFINSEDYDYWIRIIARFNAAILPEPLVKYRIYHDMISIKKRREQILYALKAKWKGRKMIPHNKWLFYKYVVYDLVKLLTPDFYYHWIWIRAGI